MNLSNWQLVAFFAIFNASCATPEQELVEESKADKKNSPGLALYKYVQGSGASEFQRVETPVGLVPESDNLSECFAAIFSSDETDQNIVISALMECVEQSMKNEPDSTPHGAA